MLAILAVDLQKFHCVSVKAPVPNWETGFLSKNTQGRVDGKPALSERVSESSEDDPLFSRMFPSVSSVFYPQLSKNLRDFSYW